VLNHLYVHGHPLIGQKRCIALNAADVTISDSYVSDGELRPHPMGSCSRRDRVSRVRPTFRFREPGTSQVSLTVTDSDGATATTTAAVQVTGVLHVSFVDAVITSGKNGKGTPHWSVSATVEAHGADERVIAGATLRVTWSGARTLSCVTGTDGRCTFNTGALSAKQSSVR
jgi:hypothetical protein